METQNAQRELIAWVSEQLPKHREGLQESLTALQGVSPDAPVNIVSLRKMLTEVVAGLDVYAQCPHLARTTVPGAAAANAQGGDAAGAPMED